MMNCSECIAYDPKRSQCHRYPKVYEKLPDDWCMEFRAKEVVVCPVEEKAKENEVRVEEKESEPVKYRGWPKGKPRKVAA